EERQQLFHERQPCRLLPYRIAGKHMVPQQSTYSARQRKVAMRQSRPYIVRRNRTIIRRFPAMGARQPGNSDGEHLADLCRRSRRGVVYRSLLKLPAKKVGLRSRSALAAICGMIVDKALRLPRPLLAGPIVT